MIKEISLMPKYELMYLLGANVAETDVPVVSAQVLKAAQDNGGTQIQETQLGKKKLAYPIKKTRNGFYVVVNFEMDSGKISRLDAKIRGMDSSIVRYLIVNTEEHLARLAKDKAEQAKIKRRIPPPVKLENKSKAEGAKIPAIKLEDIDEKMLDEKIEKALSEDVTK
ncbi:MAG: 30S ribosomal protein S6 [Candidatus Doudnabacteria bacterium]|nr:30S ribosomal protein S6 [Candidatus Doudnabacteria bacterium]